MLLPETPFEKSMNKTTLFVVLVIVALAAQKVILPRLTRERPPSVEAEPAQPPPPSTPATPQELEFLRNRVLANLDMLAITHRDFLNEHPGRSITVSDLLARPGARIAKLPVWMGEVYPTSLEPGMEISAQLPDGTLLYAHTSTCSGCPPPPPDPTSDDAHMWTERQLAAASAERLLALFIRETSFAGKSNEKERVCQALRGAVNRGPPPSPEFFDQVQAFLESPAQAPADRDMLLTTIASAPSPRTARYVVRLTKSAATPELRTAASRVLSLHNPSNADWLLTYVWIESNDPELLPDVAAAMAHRSIRGDIDLLLNAALSTDPQDALHQKIATNAFRYISKAAATERVVERLGKYTPSDAQSAIVVRAVSRIEEYTATEAALAWLQNSRQDCAALIDSLDLHPTQQQIAGIWARAKDSTVSFANEHNRAAILRRLAPRVPSR